MNALASNHFPHVHESLQSTPPATHDPISPGLPNELQSRADNPPALLYFAKDRIVGSGKVIQAAEEGRAYEAGLIWKYIDTFEKENPYLAIRINNWSEISGPLLALRPSRKH